MQPHRHHYVVAQPSHGVVGPGGEMFLKYMGIIPWDALGPCGNWAIYFCHPISTVIITLNTGKPGHNNKKWANRHSQRVPRFVELKLVPMGFATQDAARYDYFHHDLQKMGPRMCLLRWVLRLKRIAQKPLGNKRKARKNPKYIVICAHKGVKTCVCVESSMCIEERLSMHWWHSMGKHLEHTVRYIYIPFDYIYAILVCSYVCMSISM